MPPLSSVAKLITEESSRTHTIHCIYVAQFDKQHKMCNNPIDSTQYPNTNTILKSTCRPKTLLPCRQWSSRMRYLFHCCDMPKQKLRIIRIQRRPTPKRWCAEGLAPWIVGPAMNGLGMVGSCTLVSHAPGHICQ
jgi:hypothetical protein